jgi:hypothetical protein
MSQNHCKYKQKNDACSQSIVNNIKINTVPGLELALGPDIKPGRYGRTPPIRFMKAGPDIKPLSAGGGSPGR